MNPKSIQVMVVDDSAIVRGLLTRALETDPAITVSATAMHGELALSSLRKQLVDVMILDVEMPVMDGLTTLKRVQSEFPSVRVIMASSLTYQGADTTVQALALGAADCIAKPTAGSVAESINQLVQELVPLVKALGEASSPERSADSSACLVAKNYESNRTLHAIAIGASTGGPRAIAEVLTSLPLDFSVPILIVQHMPPMFTTMMAKHIQKDTGRPCQEGVDGGQIERGKTYLAPGGRHMRVDKQGEFMVTTLDDTPPQHFCRPSVNPLFQSASQWYGKSLLGVMLTGMGDDGIEGTRDLADNGAYMIAQDEASSVVWGMPAAVCRENLAHEILPLTSIGPRIVQLCRSEVCYA